MNLRRHARAPPTGPLPLAARRRRREHRASGRPTGTPSPPASTSQRSAAPAFRSCVDALHRAPRDAARGESSARATATRRDDDSAGPESRPSAASTRADPAEPRRLAGRPRRSALRRRSRERRGRGRAWASSTAGGASSRRTGSSPSSPRASPGTGGSGADREDLLDLAPPGPRRGADEGAPPRDADRLQVHRREDDVGRGGDRRRGVGGLGVSFFPPERDGVLSGLLVLEAIAYAGVSFEALLAARTRRTAPSPTAARPLTCRCRSSRPTSRA